MNVKRVETMLSDKIKMALQIMAIEGYPLEVCGVLHEHNIIHQYPNTFTGDRHHGFDMEVDINDVSIKAIWHSHPDGSDEPSADDVPCMESLASHGYTFPWLIVTTKTVTEWVLEQLPLAG